MTPDELGHDVTRAAEVLSRFFDGESVDGEALERALLAPGAVDTLIAFTRIRAQARAGHPESQPSQDPGLIPQDGGDRRWASRAVGVSGLRIAAGLCLGVLLGYWLGASSRSAEPELRPPVPTQVVHVKAEPAWWVLDAQPGRLP